MSLSAFLFQAINGLATASGLFLIAAGLSLIFGVSRIVNIAHGSLYMLGTYIAYTFATKIGGVTGFWGGIVATALIVGVIGAAIEFAAAAADLPRAGAVPAARNLRAGARRSTTPRSISGGLRIFSVRGRRGCATPSRCWAVACRATTCS